MKKMSHLFIDFNQENMRGQRGTLRALAVICHNHKVIFSFRKSVFRDVREIKKATFNDNGGFVVGTHEQFSCGYERSLFFVVYKRSLLAGYAKN